MNTPCERCGAPRSMSRPGLSHCEHCDRTPRAPLPGGEASGLIDIRAMAAAMPKLGHSPMRPPTPAPSFGLGALGPIAPAPGERPVTRRPARSGTQTTLQAVLGVLVLGVVGLAGAVVHSATRPAPTTEVVLVTSAAPASASSAARDEVEDAEPEADEADEADEAEPAVDTTPVEGPRRKPRPAARPGKADASKPDAVKPKPAPASNPPVVEDRRDSVECLLNPGSCAPKREPKPEVTPTPVAPAGADLPAKLEPADISDGTRAAKAAAMSSCSKLAKGGEVVKIKLSIAGPTGSVLSAGAESDGGNAALANCAASELKAARFKAVQKQQIGAVVTLKF